MKLTKKAILSLALPVAALVGVEASAAPKTGFYVGANAGWQHLGNTLPNAIAANAQRKAHNKLNGVDLGLHAGHQWQFDKHNIYVAVEASVGYAHGSKEETLTSPPTKIKVRTGLQSAFNVKLGRSFGNFTPYAILSSGFSQLHVRDLNGGFLVDNDSVNIKSNALTYGVGAGFKHSINDCWSVGLEYMYRKHDMSGVEIGNIATPKWNTFSHSVNAVVSYHF